jgi:hypothetical protein
MLLSIFDPVVSTGAAAGTLRGIARLRAPSGDVARVPRGESRTPTVTGDFSRLGVFRNSRQSSGCLQGRCAG